MIFTKQHGSVFKKKVWYLFISPFKLPYIWHSEKNAFRFLRLMLFLIDMSRYHVNILFVSLWVDKERSIICTSKWCYFEYRCLVEHYELYRVRLPSFTNDVLHFIHICKQFIVVVYEIKYVLEVHATSTIIKSRTGMAYKWSFAGNMSVVASEVGKQNRWTLNGFIFYNQRNRYIIENFTYKNIIFKIFVRQITRPRFLCPPVYTGGHIVFALSVCWSVRWSVGLRQL